MTAAGYQKNQPSFWGGTNGAVGWHLGHGRPSLRRRHCSLGLAGKATNSFANVARPVTMAKITDGTSHTLMVGEKYLRTDQYEGGSKSDDKGWTDGWDPDAMRSTCFQPYQDSDGHRISIPRALNSNTDLFGHDRDVYYFGSAHTGGFDAAFADGSVHTINYDIDVTVFNGLGTRAGGEMIDPASVN